MRVGIYECEKCPDPVLNALRIFGLMALVMLFLIAIIIVNIRKKKESQMSILLRIFTNYLQLIATAMSLNLKYPDFVVSTFGIIERAGNSSGSFLSFDCFVDNTGYTSLTSSTVIFKLLLSALMPVVAVIFAIAI
jgi:hypothetical protein